MTQNESQRRTAYNIYGPHGGYFFSNQARNAQAVAKLAEVMAEHPDYICTMDFEPYTLDRMAHGARLGVEKKTGKDFLEAESLATLRKLAQAGRLSIISTYTQPILFALDGESVVRQFTYARRVVQETLGIALESYATQEPCWCGQIPAILLGCGIRSALFATHWAMFGLPPYKDGEKLTWRGPDGSELPIIPVPLYAKRKDNGKPYGFHDDGNIFANRWAPALEPNVRSMQLAVDGGVHHPVFSSLASDFYVSNVKYPSYDIPGVDIVYVTIPQYLELAEDSGVWEDAFAGFKSYMCWGTWGGQYFRDAQVAADTTVLAERLEVLLGRQWDGQLDDMRVLTMLAQHHDAWVCPPARMGQWAEKYTSLTELISACRQEIEQNLATLLPRESAGTFTLCNPTQHHRREWTRVTLRRPEGTGPSSWRVLDQAGQAVPSRLHGTSAAKGDELAGYLLADIPPFATAQYTIAAGKDDSVLPVTITQPANDVFELSNGQVKLVLKKDYITLFRGQQQVLLNVHLDAHVEGAPSRGVVHTVSAEITEDGIARGTARGRIANIPFELVFDVKPWSAVVDVRVTCQFNGELIEGMDFSDQYGTLKLWLTYPKPVNHLSNQAFELRKPSSDDYWAVQYSMAEWADSTLGCVAIHDRPTGVLYEDNRTGITLCHSGNHPYGLNSTWMRGFGQDRVYGARTYETSIFPFAPEEKAEAVWKYQTKAYPLTQAPCGNDTPWLAGLQIEGHSLVSALYRRGDAVVLRLWNPLAAESLRISAPGVTFAMCDMEENILESLGKDAVELSLKPMQIRTLIVRKY